MIARTLAGRNPTHWRTGVCIARWLSSQPEEKLIYEAQYGKKIRMLRRFSLASSVASVFFIPASILCESGFMPIIGQVAMASTVLMTSLGSTAILHYVTTPYVCKLAEIPSDTKDRKFYATTVNFFGKENKFLFYLADVSKPPSHPFASCRVNNVGPLYLFGQRIEDVDVRTRMGK